MLIIGLAILAIGSDVRPNRPTDGDLLAAVAAERSGQIISLNFNETRRGGGRVGCGLIGIGGVVEPVLVMAAWQRSRPVLFREDPTAQPEAEHWEIRVVGPTRTDRDEDGQADRYDRNADSLDRKLVTLACPDLRPSPGAVWVTELEPNPDVDRAVRARRLARTLTDHLFGSHNESSPPNP